MSPKPDIRFIGFMHRFGTALALLPPFNYNDSDHLRNRSIHKYYAVFLLVLIIAGFVHSNIGRISDVYPSLPSSTLVVTDAAFNFILTVTNISSIFIPAIWNTKACNIFLNLFCKSNFLYKSSGDKHTRKCSHFCFELAIGHFLYLALVIYDGYLWSTILGFAQYKNYIFRALQIYHGCIMVELIHNFVLALKYGFQTVNESLEKISAFPPLMRNSRQTNIFYFHRLDMLNQVVQLYEILMQQVNLFNTIFGWQTLFLAASIILGFLNSLDTLTVWGIYQNRNIPLGNIEYGLIILHSCWSVALLILGTIVAASCDAAAKEAQRTAEVCYKLLLNLPLVPEKLQDQALQKQLCFLAQLSTHRCPSFSAAGFFKVDYSMLLALFGSVTSYVIVVIQFNK